MPPSPGGVHPLVAEVGRLRATSIESRSLSRAEGSFASGARTREAGVTMTPARSGSRARPDEARKRAARSGEPDPPCRLTSPPSGSPTRNCSRWRNPALLRALRPLHRDLPDLTHHRRRARKPARPHLSHKGHAGDGRAPTAQDVAPIDHCLSCLACETTCPSGVDYRRLVDHARAAIETSYRRPLADRLMRAALARLLPSRALFGAALALAASAGRSRRCWRAFPPSAAGSRRCWRWPRRRGGAARRRGRANSRRRDAPSGGASRCSPAARGAAGARDQRRDRQAAEPRRDRRRAARGRGLLRLAGASHGPRASARPGARQRRRLGPRGRRRAVEAIVVTASGCCATIKDYGNLMCLDPAYAEKGARVAALARDACEYMAGLELAFDGAAEPDGRLSRRLLVAARPEDSSQRRTRCCAAPASRCEPARAHLCCGSAGTYNILQPDMAAKLRDRKVANLARVKPDVIAASNIGCLAQIASATASRWSIRSNSWTGRAAGRRQRGWGEALRRIEMPTEGGDEAMQLASAAALSGLRPSR